MALATETGTSDTATVEGAIPVNPEVRVAAAQAILSEGDIQVSEVLRARKEETLALIQRLLASAGIEGTVDLVPADPDQELTPEQVWLGEFKTRFDALPQLHPDVPWLEVERSLNADSEFMRAFDEKGHQMMVVGEEKGEFIFVSGWDNVNQVSQDHRDIAYDPEGQRIALEQGHSLNGNAVSIIAGIMDVSEEEATRYLAHQRFNQQLAEVLNIVGCAWLKTDDATRQTGDALYGSEFNINPTFAKENSVYFSFRVELRLKKV